MADLPINYGDTWKVARDKINDSFNAVVATVEGYRPHIESWIRWIWDTNTGVKAEWDSIVMKAEDWYIWYKSDSNDWSQIIAISDLKGEKWDPWEQGNPWTPWEDWEDWNWITSVTSTKVWKTTTVIMNFDEWDPFSFEVQDWEDGGGGGWSWDVVWPNSSTDGHLAVFEGTTGKAIKDWWVMPTIPTKTSDLTNDSWFITSSALPTKVSDLTNDSGFITGIDSTDVTTALGYTPYNSSNPDGYITSSYHDATKQDTLVSWTNIKTVNWNSILGNGNLTISWLPAWWTNGQIVMMVNGVATWVNPADVWFRLQASDTEIDVPYVWSGTEAQYAARQSFSDDTEYHAV